MTQIRSSLPDFLVLSLVIGVSHAAEQSGPDVTYLAYLEKFRGMTEPYDATTDAFFESASDRKAQALC